MPPDGAKLAAFTFSVRHLTTAGERPASSFEVTAETFPSFSIVADSVT